ncbi:MAG: 30S ribosomal protein S8 [Minisyncoccia bacterium]
MTDKISDMLNRLKNAGAVGHATTLVPYSSVNLGILSILSQHGFVGSFEKPKKGARTIEVTLEYKNAKPRIRGVKRFSKPSRRVYKRVSDIRPVKNGYGIMVISTPQGLKTDAEARTEKVGGEAMFSIW